METEAQYAKVMTCVCASRRTPTSHAAFSERHIEILIRQLIGDKKVDWGHCKMHKGI